MFLITCINYHPVIQKLFRGVKYYKSLHIITSLMLLKHKMLYRLNLLTPTWPLCKNILSVDYKRSISFRKCNRWKSFEIVHVCLNNKKCYNIQYDYDDGQWRLGRSVSEHCLRSGSRGFEPQQSGWQSKRFRCIRLKQRLIFCKLLVLIISFYFFCVFGVHCFSSADYLIKKPIIKEIKTHTKNTQKNIWTKKKENVRLEPPY